MSVDFSTISLNGLIAIMYLSIIVIIIVVLISKNIKKGVKIKHGDKELSLGGSSQDVEAYKQNCREKYSSLLVKQINTMSIHLKSMTHEISKYLEKELGRELGDFKSWLVMDNFTRLLEKQLIYYIIENHIGVSDFEIREYSKMRGMQVVSMLWGFYQSMTDNLPEDVINVIENKMNKKDAEDYFIQKLFVIFTDCKQLEKL